MAVKFANRMNLLKGSEIRALLALTAKPEVISFRGRYARTQSCSLQKALRKRLVR